MLHLSFSLCKEILQVKQMMYCVLHYLVIHHNFVEIYFSLRKSHIKSLLNTKNITSIGLDVYYKLYMSVYIYIAQGCCFLEGNSGHTERGAGKFQVSPETGH